MTVLVDCVKISVTTGIERIKGPIHYRIGLASLARLGYVRAGLANMQCC